MVIPKRRSLEKEALQWRDLSIEVWFKIQNEREVVTKNGESKSLTLESSDGDIVRVWSCIDLLREELPLGARNCAATG